ncbi:MAG: hypothetical protein K8F24_10720 [Bacteroidales bacterium]|nr:hypothetical protein [Bacteroidales bacterium]
MGGIFLSSCTRKTVEDTEDDLLTEIEDLWDNGNPKTVRFYKEGAGEKTLVKEKQYYPGGQLKMEGSFENTLREGEWKSWYEDGTLWSSGSFKAGKRHGIGIVYHPNGTKSIEGTYEEGRRTGLWKSWDESGNLISEQRFD